MNVHPRQKRTPNHVSVGCVPKGRQQHDAYGDVVAPVRNVMWEQTQQPASPSVGVQPQPLAVPGEEAVQAHLLDVTLSVAHLTGVHAELNLHTHGKVPGETPALSIYIGANTV